MPDSFFEGVKRREGRAWRKAIDIERAQFLDRSTCLRIEWRQLERQLALRTIERSAVTLAFQALEVGARTANHLARHAGERRVGDAIARESRLRCGEAQGSDRFRDRTGVSGAT